MAARVIVFGPTGSVGSIVARTAQEHGAKVFLAMRDIQKPIPGLSPEQESRGGFERVHADLTQPESIVSAVKQTNATSAFMYLAHRSTDHMKATLEASKAAGIDFMVFLSSFTVKGDLDKIKPTDRIPYIHARVEMNLEQVYGSRNYVALRPGAFATNTRRWRAGFQSGEVTLNNADTEYDYITPDDMGSVGGIVLARGQQDGQHIVYLYGPKLMAQKDAIVVAGAALGKDVAVIPTDAHDGPPARRASDNSSHRVIVRLGEDEPKSEWFKTAYANLEEGVNNILKYTGKPSLGYKEWVEGNKMLFND